MKRTLLIAGSAAVLLLAGCSSSPMSSDSGIQTLSLAGFRAEAQPEYTGSGVFHLGAGDELGREVFANYLVYLRTNDGPHYATGENPSPQDD